MSTRKSRKSRTAIQYELSEWDAELPKLRKRSNSVDLLDELRRSSKKFHSRSHTAVARFPQHYCGDEYVASSPNQRPNTTYAKSHRYSKEANVKECHEWAKTNTNTAVRGTQCDLKGDQRHSYVQCNPPTREMVVQTHRWSPEAAPIKLPLKTEIQHESFDYEKLLAMIEARLRMPECPGSHVPEEVMLDISASMAEFLALLQTVHKQAGIIDEKEDASLTAIKKIKLTSGPNGIPEELLDMLQKLLDQKDALSDEVVRLIHTLKEEHTQILNAIRSINPTVDNSLEREYYLRMTAMLEEILMYLRVEEVEEIVKRRELYGGKCRCNKIRMSVTALLSASGSAMTPGVCQRCVNDRKGHLFLTSLKLPITVSAETVNTFGRIIECIENDDEFHLKHLFQDVEDTVPPEWEARHYQVTYEALFLMALLWQTKKCSFILAGLVDVKMMLRSMKTENHRYELPNYVRLAVESRDIDTLKRLFEPMAENQRIAVINQGALQTNGTIICPLFEAARNGDVEMFAFLIQCGASLDVRETDKSILHEIARISNEKEESPKHKEWNNALVAMLGLVYEQAGIWWEKQLVNDAWSGCTEASIKNALSYLFSITDRNGHNALQYAAKHASPEIIKKMIYTEPYEFIPDPLEFGYDNGSKGYVVDQIESRLAFKDESVLERMILRDQLDGAQVLAIEPFRSMIKDKWRRFRFFYAIWFICYLCFMLIYSGCAVQRPVGATTYSDMYVTREDYGRLVGEIFILLCLPLFFYGEIRDGARIGFVVPRPWLRTGMFRLSNLFFVITTIAVIILRLTFNPNEDIALSLALLIGWLNALEFLGAWKSVGMFVTVLHRAFTHDVALKFAMVFGIALAGTSTATYVIYQTSPLQPIAEYPNATFWMTPYTLTKLGMTLFREDYSTDAVNSGFAIALYLTFIFLFNFLLFGLVIGMFADTYSTTKKKVSASWIWVTATYALLMDRRLPAFLCIRYSDKAQTEPWRGVTTKLKYITRSVRKVERDGKLVDKIEHVVLLAKEDKPRPISLQLADTEIMWSRLRTPRE